jgi:D-alanyl-D-alanine carboxypeptidase/D-alanyl-D-alanine-endopeptidase (penicillin-binding protein 4)
MVKGLRKRVNKYTQSATLIIMVIALHACSIQKAQKTLLATPALQGAHIGIAVYNDTKHIWVDKYQSDHYFTPASNTKILATFVGLTYLGDSLPGWKMSENKDTIVLTPLGDPSFMHPDFSYQPIVDLLKSTKKQVYIAANTKDHFDAFGDGWAWNDYAEDYQPERSRMPIYGNVVHFYKEGNRLAVRPSFFNDPLKNKEVLLEDMVNASAAFTNSWTRKKSQNVFFVTTQKSAAKYAQVPFVTSSNTGWPSIALLMDTIQMNIGSYKGNFNASNTHIIKTIPTDSLLKIMMRRSDNFFAEQVVLMASEQLLGKMDDAAMIDTVLKSSLAGLPQKIRWADGSGLSRYNLNTPENYVAILQRMQDRFGQARVANIFEKGGEGTLSAYFKNFPGELHAKTGSLGGQIALSGLIFTQKKQKLYFSILVSNHMSPTSAGVRRAVESYLRTVASKN